MKTVHIFGAQGYVGSHLAEYFGSQGYTVLTTRIDVTDYPSVLAYLSGARPGIVINAAGRTGTPNVDWCETHQEETMLVNVAGAVNVAIACHSLGLYLCHIGSGCIYQGDNGGKGYSEDDAANFFGSFYSRTKALSEMLIKEFHPLQLRIRIPIEGKSHPKNAIDKLLRYEKIISVENSFTIMEDFAPAAYALCVRGERGVFNMTNSGHMNHAYLMDAYKEHVDPTYVYKVMSVAELAKVTSAPRSNCILDTSKREKMDVVMPDIKERMPAIMQAYKKNLHD